METLTTVGTKNRSGHGGFRLNDADQYKKEGKWSTNDSSLNWSPN